MPIGLPHHSRCRAWLFGLAGWCLACAGGIGTLHASELDTEYRALRARFAGQLDELAVWCDAQGLVDEAKQTRAWLPPADAMRVWVPLIDHHTATIAGATDQRAQSSNGDQHRDWKSRFDKLRAAQSAALFALAEKAVADGRASLGFSLAWETLHEDPNHAAARRVFGYEQTDGRWLTAFEARKARDGQVWNNRFGWLPRDHVERYEAGERFNGARWTTAAADAQAHEDIRKGWLVGTEHYLVRTNHSLEEGVRLAERLEWLHRVWEVIFVGFTGSEEQLARRFRGQAARRGEPARHKVVYYRSRDEYVQALKKDQPNIDITTGYYLGERREAYFFFDPENADDSNLYHEATHQLFNETRPVVRDVGHNANFWIVEGIACLMESLVVQDGWCAVGGADAIRFDNARHRLLVDNFYVPLAELTALGMKQLQQDERIARLYSQASGLTYFLMFDAAGRYRRPLVDYLVAVYTGRDRPTTLEELTGASYQELDKQYREFVSGSQ